ncbi:MAG: cohesin domain-containing protein [Methanoregula sp.]|nr:cohesin domain-containing protein [Methanoregula sp.]
MTLSQQSKRSLTGLIVLLSLAAMALPTSASTILSIPAVKANPGDRFEIPVTCTDAVGIGSMNLKVAYDPQVVTVTGVKKGTLTSSSILDYHVESGTVVIALVDLNGFSGTGTIATLDGTATSGTGSISALQVNEVAVNNISTLAPVSVDVNNGQLTIGNPAPGTASSGTGSSSSDSGYEPPLPTGTTIPVGSTAPVMVTLDDVTTGYLQEFRLPVTLANASNLGTVSLVLTFDPATFEVTGIESGELTRGAVFSGTPFADHVNLEVLSPQGVQGAGTLTTITFRVREGAQPATTIGIASAVINAATTLQEIPVLHRNATIKITGVPQRANPVTSATPSLNVTQPPVGTAGTMSPAPSPTPRKSGFSGLWAIIGGLGAVSLVTVCTRGRW